ncbi:hypothetical protein GWI68_11725 [Proteus sp. G2669]|uniref:hypothetical protein n=1 Tax=Proteus sp. G2669 TaxID=2698881 RepID=UPI0014122937|nr:hypothetical protein [Proteus sp. G2669]NBM55429.1 hypothetical protein [Proteus sp. G2669]
MNNLYYLYDDLGNTIFTSHDFIECYDFSDIGYSYLFLFTEVSIQNKNYLYDKKIFTLRSKLFHNRLNISFSVKKVISHDNILYLYIGDLSSGIYKIGTMSFLKSRKNDIGRIWLDMKGDKKKIYLSASYLINGDNLIMKKNNIIIEGKYINDYYSFYCELGYSFIGQFGYMGDSFYALEDYLSQLNQINVIWKDSELSLKNIDNTMPDGYIGRSAHDLVSILREYCNLTLE